MTTKKFYSDVQFVKIENLKGRAKEVANAQGLTNGLALMKVSINSLPEYEIEKVSGDPLNVLKNLAQEDNISPQNFDDSLVRAFSL